MGNLLDFYPIASIEYQFTDTNTSGCQIEAYLEFEETNVVVDSLSITDSSSYDWIVELCDNPEIVGCDFSDLIWQTDSCECPSCSCTTIGESTLFETSNSITKACYECLCEDTGYNCESIGVSYAADDDFNEFECLLSLKNDTSTNADYNDDNEDICTNYDGDTYSVNEYFWNTTDEGKSFFSYDNICDELCLCQSDGSWYCITGYENVRNDDTIWSILYPECESNLLTCLDDTSQWVQDGCYSFSDCPICKCNYTEWTLSNSESYWISFIDTDEEYSCAKCECTSSNEIDCDIDESSSEEITCPPNLTCTEDDTFWESNNCYDPDQNYCGKMKWEDYGVYDGIAYFEDDSDMGCFPDWQCETYGTTNNDCVEADLSFTSRTLDCDDNSIDETTVETSYYLSCCQTDNCNNITLDESTCTTSLEMSTVYSTLYECFNSESFVSGAFGQSAYCGDSDALDSYSACEFFEISAEYYTSCYCEAYSTIYNDVSDDFKTALDNQMNIISFYALIVQIFSGCDVTWSCDLSTGKLSFDYSDDDTYYTVSFTLTLLGYDETNWDETTIINDIATVISVNASDTEIGDPSYDTNGATFEVIVSFDTEIEATDFQTDLENDAYNFGTGSTVYDVGDVQQDSAYWSNISIIVISASLLLTLIM